MIGQKYGRLEVYEEIVEKKYKCGQIQKRFICKCDCGKRTVVLGPSLISGNTRSCGCLQREMSSKMNTIHGKSKTSTHQIWKDIRRRCTNPNREDYKHYGGRGISICKRWNDFNNFLADMGERPEGLTLERIDNNGNYEPGNCKWATRKEQANNRRWDERNVWIEYQGRKMILAHWSRELGIDRTTLTYRLKRWPLEKAMEVI